MPYPFENLRFRKGRNLVLSYWIRSRELFLSMNDAMVWRENHPFNLEHHESLLSKVTGECVKELHGSLEGGLGRPSGHELGL